MKKIALMMLLTLSILTVPIFKINAAQTDEMRLPEFFNSTQGPSSQPINYRKEYTDDSGSLIYEYHLFTFINSYTPTVKDELVTIYTGSNSTDNPLFKHVTGVSTIVIDEIGREFLLESNLQQGQYVEYNLSRDYPGIIEVIEDYQFYYGVMITSITTNDYDSGYIDGYNYGREDGYDDGYDKGYIDGEQNGYDIGYGVGYNKGVNDGLGDSSGGYDIGYKIGYEEGSEKSFLANFNSWIVPAIIVVMFVGGFFAVARQKRDGD